MSSSEQEMQEQTTPFKTIEVQPATRHPTSNKKKTPYSPSYKTNPQTQYHHYQRPKSQRSQSQSLRQSISAMKMRKYHCLEKGRYREASYWDKQITKTQSMIGQIELKRARYNSIAEKRSIRCAYQHEISFFESAWNNYFDKFKQVQRTKIQKFKVEQESQIEKARQRLRQRCSSLRKVDKEVLQLEKAEEYHLRKGNVKQLGFIRSEKKKIVANAKKQRKQLIQMWTKKQSQSLSREQSKKYQILINRLEERRKDQQKNYILQRKRLRQKYKNVLSQLRHQQKMTLHFVTRWTQPSQS